MNERWDDDDLCGLKLTAHASKNNYDKFRNKLHVALIMDGNGRWATRQGLKRFHGHKAGADTVMNLIQDIPEEVGVITAYAFSLENWNRSLMEVYHLLRLAQELLGQHLPILIEKGIRVRFIGNIAMLPSSFIKLIQQVEQKTMAGEKLLLNFAVSYGSRQEILAAAEKGKDLDKYLSTAGLADPDILIRTGGQRRLSNYLLWQVAYTELFFLDKYWPDFTVQDLREVLDQYSARNRQYGTVA